jgi:hypothetical protein
MIEHSELVRRYCYDPETGVFTRKTTVSKHKAGTVCGSRQHHNYLRISIDKRPYWAHRLAWFYVHAEWPKKDIDHINGDGGDNRIANLREATMSQNLMNTKTRTDNTSGFKGVSKDNRRGRWEAYVHKDGKKKSLGSYKTKEEAARAYVAAATAMHGEFVRHELIASVRE